MTTVYECLIGYGAVAMASLATLLAMAYGEDRTRQRAERTDEAARKAGPE